MLTRRKKTMETLAEVGISMKEVTDKLTDDGVKLFRRAFDKLLEAVEKNTQWRDDLQSEPADLQTCPRHWRQSVQSGMNDWRATGKDQRLWQRDASLWTGTDEANWLGWLTSPRNKSRTAKICRKRSPTNVKRGGFKRHSAARHGRLEPLPRSLGNDLRPHRRLSAACTCSTRPIPRRSKSFEKQVDLAKTLFIVSSKSGTRSSRTFSSSISSNG